MTFYKICNSSTLSPSFCLHTVLPNKTSGGSFFSCAILMHHRNCTIKRHHEKCTPMKKFASKREMESPNI